MNTKILKILEKDARTDINDIIAITGLSEKEVRREIDIMEEAGIIRGYRALIDWERADSAKVSAIIELKVTPKAGLGFEEVADRIAGYPEVEAVYLMSGACDLIVLVKGKTFHEVSEFVAKELALIDSVTSTATQFIMRKYKDSGVILNELLQDERSKISL